MTTVTSVSETQALTGRLAKPRSWCHVRTADAQVGLINILEVLVTIQQLLYYK